VEAPLPPGIPSTEPTALTTGAAVTTEGTVDN
jgi:hypothetical protein